MARRRGKQKGYLRQQGPSWIGCWWEEVRLTDGRLDWHRASKQICRTTEIDGSGKKKTVTKKEAQRRFDEQVLTKLETRSLNPQSLATMREFVELKYRPLLAFKRRKSQEHANNMLNNHVLPALGHLQLRDPMMSEHVQSLILSKVAQGKSSQTVQHVRTRISAIFRKAKQMGWYSGDLPTDGIEMPKLVHRERVALTKEQALALLEELPPTTRAMVLTLALTGLRIGELCGLKWSRVNLTDKPIVSGGDFIEPQSIAIRETWVKVYGKHLSKDIPRGQYQDVKNPKNGRRDVPLASLVVNILRAVHGERNGRNTGPDDPVFCGETGRPIDAHNELARRFKPACEALRKRGYPIPSIAWNDLRHTASTWADQGGLTETERERILGQSRTVNRHYTKAHVDHARAGIERMAAGLESAIAPKLKRVK